jgi:hypothetical protein
MPTHVNTVTASGEQAEAVSGLLQCVLKVHVMVRAMVDTGAQSTIMRDTYMLSIDTCNDEVESSNCSPVWERWCARRARIGGDSTAPLSVYH